MSDEAEFVEDLLNYTGPISVDTETISLNDRNCIGVGVAIEGKEFYFPVLPEPSSHLPVVLGILSDPRRVKVYFNAMFDLRVIDTLARDENLPRPSSLGVEDASIMGQVQGRESNELDELSERYLGYRNPFKIKDLLLSARDGKKGANMLDVPMEAVALKNQFDTRQTLQLYEFFKDRWVDEAQRECYTVDLQVLTMLLEMEEGGLLLDDRKVEEFYEELRRDVLGYERLCDEHGFRPGSPQQVGYVLASRGNILPFTRGVRRQLRTDEESLEVLDDPLARVILQYRKVGKLLSTYVVPYRGRDRAYTHFRIDLATGRLASGQFGKAHKHVCRNMQNIPNSGQYPMRSIFVPDSGSFSWMDYSQIEMRVLANLAHDQNMLAAFERGESIHMLTLNKLWPGVGKKDSAGNDTWEYLTSKTFNFAMAYYAMDTTLAKHTKLPLQACSEFKALWLNELFPGCRDFMEARMADPSPVAITEFGRRMKLPTIEEMREVSENAGNWFNEKSAQNHINKCKINYVIQGTAADIMKRGMLMLSGESGVKLQVHDELVVDGDFQFPDEMSYIHPEFKTPFEVHKGDRWQ